jgi:hypothetical protein
MNFEGWLFVLTTMQLFAANWEKHSNSAIDQVARPGIEPDLLFEDSYDVRFTTELCLIKRKARELNSHDLNGSHGLANRPGKPYSTI